MSFASTSFGKSVRRLSWDGTGQNLPPLGLHCTYLQKFAFPLQNRPHQANWRDWGLGTSALPFIWTGIATAAVSATTFLERGYRGQGGTARQTLHQT